jgi:hypothetical protein
MSYSIPCRAALVYWSPPAGIGFLIAAILGLGAILLLIQLALVGLRLLSV